MKEEDIKIPFNGKEIKIKTLKYDINDFETVKNIYKYWLSLNLELLKVKSRSINIPEGLSEVAFCLFMNTVRVSESKNKDFKTSFDVYDLEKNKKIQLKSTSVYEDLTSFGPESEWDDLYFLDFFKDGKWDGSFDVYLIANALIYNQKVNKKQSFKDVQKEGKRPRFSIKKEIISVCSLKPIKTFNIYSQPKNHS